MTFISILKPIDFWILEIELCSPFEKNGIEWNQGEESWLYIWGKLFEFLKLFGCFSILRMPKEISENPHIFSSLYLGRQFMFLIWKDKSLVKMLSKILSTFVLAPMFLTREEMHSLATDQACIVQCVASDGIPSVSFTFSFPTSTVKVNFSTLFILKILFFKRISGSSRSISISFKDKVDYFLRITSPLL